jgi:hypothetical protein
VHLCYIDEAGSTGKDLTSAQQRIFVMAGLLVSDEKWRKTEREARALLREAFGGSLPQGFELHACDLLAPTGQGVFQGWNRSKRDQMALDLLRLIDERSHQVLVQLVHKPRMATAPAPTSVPLRLDWKDPWEVAFASLLTMTEEILQSRQTGRSSTGMVIIDDNPLYLGVVRTQARDRQDAGGWRHTRKVMEIGYSAVSHANVMIQLADLLAFTMKKHAESKAGYGSAWSPAAHKFFQDCNDVIWPRVKFKMLKFSSLTVPAAFTDYLKTVRELK